MDSRGDAGQGDGDDEDLVEWRVEFWNIFNSRLNLDQIYEETSSPPEEEKPWEM